MFNSVVVFQAHLLSVFDNTRTVTFDEKMYDKITHINSQEGETVALDETIMAQVGCTTLSYLNTHVQFVNPLMTLI